MPRFVETEKDREKREVGDNLRRWREVAGLSQHQLALELGVERNVVHRYETGENTMSLIRAAEISSILHISVSDLVPDKFRQDEEQHKRYKEAERVDFKTKMLLERIGDLSPEELEEFYKIADITIKGVKVGRKTA